MTTSWSLVRRSQVAASRRSPSTKSILSITGARLSTELLSKLSTTVTRAPASTSCGVRYDPRKPAPPPTSTRLFCQKPFSIKFPSSPHSFGKSLICEPQNLTYRPCDWERERKCECADLSALL